MDPFVRLQGSRTPLKGPNILPHVLMANEQKVI